MVGQFSSIGTNLVIVLPGRSGTGGFNPANAITSTPRDLTIDDAASLRRLPTVRRVAPLAVGNVWTAWHGGIGQRNAKLVTYRRQPDGSFVRVRY